MDITTKLNLAKELAISFGSPVERAEFTENTSTDPNSYPRVLETIFQRSKEELADSEAMVSLIANNGLLYERPLTFAEIVARIEELGYELKPRDIEE